MVKMIREKLEGKARELLKAVYLKPLRDAEREMSSGKNSRISQILMSHPVFNDRDGHRLKEILSNANSFLFQANSSLFAVMPLLAVLVFL